MLGWQLDFPAEMLYIEPSKKSRTYDGGAMKKNEIEKSIIDADKNNSLSLKSEGNVVNRKALKELLQELYETDANLIDRFESDDSFFDKVVHNFIEITTQALSVKEQKMFFSRYGIEDGVRKSLLEVAEKFETTREMIRQKTEKAVSKMKIIGYREHIFCLLDPGESDYYFAQLGRNLESRKN